MPDETEEGRSEIEISGSLNESDNGSYTVQSVSNMADLRIDTGDDFSGAVMLQSIDAQLSMADPLIEEMNGACTISYGGSEIVLESNGDIRISARRNIILEAGNQVLIPPPDESKDAKPLNLPKRKPSCIFDLYKI